jgi:hypothetical protein
MYTLFDTKLLNMTGLNTVQFQSDGTISTDDKAAACLQAAAYLKELAGETWQTGLNIRVGDISQVSEALGAVAQGSSQTSFAKGILLIGIHHHGS